MSFFLEQILNHNWQRYIVGSRLWTPWASTSSNWTVGEWEPKSVTGSLDVCGVIPEFVTFHLKDFSLNFWNLVSNWISLTATVRQQPEWSWKGEIYKLTACYGEKSKVKSLNGWLLSNSGNSEYEIVCTTLRSWLCESVTDLKIDYHRWRNPGMCYES